MTGPSDWQLPPCTLPPACQGPHRDHGEGGFVVVSDTLVVPLKEFSHPDQISDAYQRAIKYPK